MSLHSNVIVCAPFLFAFNRIFACNFLFMYTHFSSFSTLIWFLLFVNGHTWFQQQHKLMQVFHFWSSFLAAIFGFLHFRVILQWALSSLRRAHTQYFKTYVLAVERNRFSFRHIRSCFFLLLHASITSVLWAVAVGIRSQCMCVCMGKPNANGKAANAAQRSVYWIILWKFITCVKKLIMSFRHVT